MGDNKRHSGLIATPRLGGQPTMSMETTITRCIGAKIRVTTIAPSSQALEGIIFALHPTSNLLTLVPNLTKPATITSRTIVPLSSIQTFTLLDLPANTIVSPPLQPVDINTQQARLRATISRLQAEDAKKGKGVSKEAQDIFDGLSRTLQCRWDGQNIVVLDQVLILPPYTGAECKAGKGVNSQMLGRVVKVLEAERKKLAEKGRGGAGSPVRANDGENQRKGG